jgi:CubicO group peptidase (beta-lactamase class C family)
MTRAFHLTVAAAAGTLYLTTLVCAVAQTQGPDRLPPRPAAIAPPSTLPESAEIYATIFDAWVARRRPTTAIFAVRRAGRTVFLKGHGVDPRQPTLIASMSKMITGICVATLVRDGKLLFASPMREALAEFFKHYGRALDRRFEKVTVEQLLVHRSGLAGNAADPINSILAARAARGMAARADLQPILAERLRRPLARAPGESFNYSNANYIALGAVIENRTGTSYESYCRESVLEKRGIASARLAPEWRQFSAAAGWMINAEDYLKLADVFDVDDAFLGDQAKTWIDLARTRWKSGNHGDWYSLGVNTFAGAGRWSVSHGGKLNSHGRDTRGRPIAATVAGFFQRMANRDALLIVLIPTQGADAAISDLRREIARAQVAGARSP